MEKYRDVVIEVKVNESSIGNTKTTKTVKAERTSVSDKTIIGMLIYTAKQLGIEPKDIYDFIYKSGGAEIKKEEKEDTSVIHNSATVSADVLNVDTRALEMLIKTIKAFNER